MVYTNSATDTIEFQNATDEGGRKEDMKIAERTQENQLRTKEGGHTVKALCRAAGGHDDTTCLPSSFHFASATYAICGRFTMWT